MANYATRDEVKAALRITDNVDNSLIDIALEAASREIDGYTERVFSLSTATRVFTPTDSFLTEIDDLYSITTLKTSSDGSSFTTTWQSSDYQLEPLNGIAGGISQPYTRVRAIGSYLFPVWDAKNPNAYEATVQITGVWGWSSVPAAVKQACILYAARQFKRYDAPLGVAGFGDIGVMNITRIDPDVMALLSPYRRVRMA